MNQEDYKKIKEAIDSAQDSVAPFPVMDGDELAVVGDANETQLNKHTYEMRFKVPIEEDGKRKIVIKKVEYKDVYVTPRQEPKIVQSIVELLPFFKKIKEDGTVGELTEEESWQILCDMDQAIYDNMYALVGNFLHIDRSLWDYMVAGDVVGVVVGILSDFHETVNEADTFFE